MKVLSLITIVLILYMSMGLCANAETIDLSRLSYEELSFLKTQVDQEYYSREESGQRTLFPGFYTVGVDFPAGSYYFCVTEPGEKDSYIHFELYPSKESYMNRNTKGAITYTLYYGTIGEYLFGEGNYLYLKNSKMTISQNPIPDDYFINYEPPKGTLVPEGTYVVGIELPEGSYYVFPSTIKSPYFAIYRDEQSTRSSYSSPIDEFRVVVTNNNNGKLIELKEGQAIVIKYSDVIMQKRKTEDLIFE